MKMKNNTFATVAAVLSPFALAETSIDILGVYTTETANKMEHTAAIQHRFNVGNQILNRSDIDVKLNLIGLKEYNYDSEPGQKKSLSQALDAISPSSNQSPIFADIEQVREEKGADMVALFRYLDTDNSPDYSMSRFYDPVSGELWATQKSVTCGMAHIVPALNWTSRWYSESAKSRMYSHSYINECGDDTFIHEIGHNFGLLHARQQYTGLAHPYYETDEDAYGYGVQGKLATTMAYGYMFGISSNSYTFSNPDTQCADQACGVQDEANAARVIRVSAPHIANIYPSKSEPVMPTPESPANPETQAVPESPANPETQAVPESPVNPEPQTVPDNRAVLPDNPDSSEKTFSFGKKVKLPDATKLKLPVSVTNYGKFEKTIIKLNIKHEYVGDLSIRLIDPNGRAHTIKRANGHDRSQFYTMTYTFSRGRPINVQGEWLLKIADRYKGDEGVLNSATITFE